VDIRQDLRQFIESKAITKREKLDFGDEDNFFALGIVSSLFAMQLVTYIEKAYHVTFEDDDLDLSNFRSIETIVRFVDKKRGAA